MSGSKTLHKMWSEARRGREAQGLPALQGEESREKEGQTQHTEPMILSKTQIQTLIDKLEENARDLELESVAKRHALHKDRQAEGLAAAQAAVITRSQIQELSALLH